MSRPQPAPSAAPYDLVCYSHLRWGFVYQRPQHLMRRFAARGRVFYVEEPVAGGADGATYATPEGVTLLVPPLGGPGEQAAVLERMLRRFGVRRHVAWYTTPLALAAAPPLAPLARVYDCMDELSGFQGASRSLLAWEERLLESSDLVFTGGHSLYEAKRDRHPSAHCFPSSVDAAHFARARGALPEPGDQARIDGPRIGFFGVIDERLDPALLAGLADARPAYQFVVLGPVVKIDPDVLPRRANLHYLGQKPYAELPSYLAGWDAAIMPFARSEATRYISPTKTLEYLAAGRPVVSTPIADVVNPFGRRGLVRVAADVESFAAALDASLSGEGRGHWLAEVDRHLATTSWDRTWAAMAELVDDAVAAREAKEALA